MLIELSSLLHENMPRWPTNPSERLDTVLQMERGDACNASSAYHHMHNGTHVDAPLHFSKNGKNICEIPIEDFCFFSPLLLTIKKRADEKITIDDLTQYEPKIMQADILCIYSGFSDLKETDPETYVHCFPSFTQEAALYLRTMFPKLKALALDFLSVDSAKNGSSEGFLAHKALLDTLQSGEARTLLIFEDVNLNRLAISGAEAKQIFALPIRWKNAEAAPVCMIAVC